MARTIELPQMTDTMAEGTLVSWLKAEGDAVQAGEPIAEIETDKAIMELEAPEGGVLLKAFVAVGDTIPCGGPVACVGNLGDPIPDATGASALATKTGPAPKHRGRTKASPAARKIATAAALGLDDVGGTGPGGRIVRRDVEAALAARAAAPPSEPAQAVPTGGVVPIGRIRRKMIERLVATHQTVPTFSLTRRIVMDAAAGFRDGLVATATFSGGIGYTELIVKAAARAMRDVPALNARFTDEGIRSIEDANIGVAVGLDEGVVVPVIRRCQAKTLRQIADDFRGLTERAKRNALLAADMGNSTFTVSNLGMYDIDEFTAIPNAPDAAIMAVGAIAPQAIVRGNAVAIARLMAVTLTVDHRVADGVAAARWLAAFAGYLENPIKLLVD